MRVQAFKLQALKKIADDLRGVPIDVVLYVDRLDLYRVDSLDQAYLLFQKVIRPVLESNQRRVEADEQRVWTLRGLQRKAMGLHAANKPSDDVAKRLSQMYDDD
ncbi:hypothetical protein GPECTOR_349g100 [Gonium pectorale]|uniref:Uncharacterized protein n=1 Tax=Gonium pectorale TaxID=33097 RepID=A0A150FVN7_GONPE|nr:hypothetical protein GPECTOR_349g100 [Gonium pectorale]|eukprot:KXZ41638.1 hypothetical protein GPECTOR_349g100 [Gonium pectorale]